ncbi:MAG: MarR family transcriptional regulator, partial [Burkholderiales bacterium]|nr:MarR family transcriptional regulator [Burkholderiales bacterium]
LVRRRRDKHDRRTVFVSLSSKGRQAIDSAIQLRLDAADESLGTLTARERRELAKLLRKVRIGKAQRE